MSMCRVTVYAASSQALDGHYISAAHRLGQVLARAGFEIVYGGGAHGLMGAMADAALAEGGEVHGVIPEFLTHVECGHQKLASLEVVPDMHTRKSRMLERSDAVIALPGGCGTFEELFEAMTLKRLGQFLGPIILVNTNRYYDTMMQMLRHSVQERFMNRIHLRMWRLVDEPEQVPDALGEAPKWSASRIKQAAVTGEVS